MEWSDTYVARFTWTDEPVGHDVFPSFAVAREHALVSARDERDQWAGTVRDLRALTVSDVEGNPDGN